MRTGINVSNNRDMGKSKDTNNNTNNNTSDNNNNFIKKVRKPKFQQEYLNPPSENVIKRGNKKVLFSITEEEYEILGNISDKHNRSVANFVGTIVKNYIRLRYTLD